MKKCKKNRCKKGNVKQTENFYEIPLSKPKNLIYGNISFIGYDEEWMNLEKKKNGEMIAMQF